MKLSNFISGASKYSKFVSTVFLFTALHNGVVSGTPSISRPAEHALSNSRTNPSENFNRG